MPRLWPESRHDLGGELGSPVVRERHEPGRRRTLPPDASG
jgi:hypothetical protein